MDLLDSAIHGGAGSVELKSPQLNAVSCRLLCELVNLPQLVERHREFLDGFDDEPFGLSELFGGGDSETLSNLPSPPENVTAQGRTHILGMWLLGYFKVFLFFKNYPSSSSHEVVLCLKWDLGTRRVAIARIRDAKLYLRESIPHATGTKPRTRFIAKDKDRDFSYNYYEDTLVIRFSARRWVRRIAELGSRLDHKHCEFMLNFSYDTAWPVLYSNVGPSAITMGTSRFLDVFTREDYYHLLKTHLDVRSTRALQSSCKVFRHLLKDAVSFRVRNELGVYFPTQLTALQQCLRNTGAIIAGSTALRCLFVSSLPWRSGDLDVIVEQLHLKEVLGFLKECSYEELPWPGTLQADDPRPFSGSLGAYTAVYNATLEKKIDVTISTPSKLGGPFSEVLQYHSSVVMNYVSGWRLVSLFPDYTLKGQNLKNDEEQSTEKSVAALSKYSDRGFPVMQTNTEEETSIQEIIREMPTMVVAEDVDPHHLFDPGHPPQDARLTEADPSVNEILPDETQVFDSDDEAPSFRERLLLNPQSVRRFAWGTSISFTPPGNDEWTP